MRRAYSSVLVLVTIVWGCAVVWGFRVLLDYAGTPGADGVATCDWPTDSPLVLDHSRLTILVALHPRCPCSRATVSELAEIMARCPGQARVHVLFLKPSSFPGEWEHTSLWEDVAAIPDVEVQSDEDGKEIRRFGAFTSGQLLVFNPGGKILFRGGITVSRAHAGDNAGREAILSLLTTGTELRAATPVFGCPLFDPEIATNQLR
jgi:hypothetical protein